MNRSTKIRRSSPEELRLLTYVASIPLSTRTLIYLSDLIRARRREVGSRWRRLDPGRQALLVLAHLRNGDTYGRLAGGFGICVGPPDPHIPGGAPSSLPHHAP